ncbi:MAG: bifunctional riboflavin kinase/FAD synthetase [Acholeplasmataceae bacterium]|nr:bifunctional riboflavin kinase/FAD synthetase [Acholeplasmataceae bacterium]
MMIIHLKATDRLPVAGLCLCLGFFDGMHLAHRRLFEVTLDLGRSSGAKTGIMTFSSSILAHIKKQKYDALTRLEDKINIAKTVGFDYCFILEVDDDLAGLPAEVFSDRFLQDSHKLIVGYDYTFGNNASGDVDFLKKKFPSKTVVVDEMQYYRKKIGSRRIKEALLSGRIGLANRLLGYKYTIRGRVIPGKGRGKSLGYPTANIDYDGYFLPKIGVYHTLIRIHGLIYDSMTNVGCNPTFGNDIITLETHVFGITGQLYDEEVEISFERFLREEIGFPAKDKLILQLQKDEQTVKDIIKSRRKL